MLDGSFRYPCLRYVDLANARQVVAYDLYFDRTIDQILSEASLKVFKFFCYWPLSSVYVYVYIEQASFLYSTNRIFIRLYIELKL